MKLLLYANWKNKAKKRLQDAIENIFPKKQIEIYRTIDNLSKGLCRPKYDVVAAILFAGNRKALSDLVSIRDLLSDLKIILILPDRDNDTVSIGHSLFPRYQSFADSDFTNVAAVLKKMLIGNGQMKTSQDINILDFKWGDMDGNK